MASNICEVSDGRLLKDELKVSPGVQCVFLGGFNDVLPLGPLLLLSDSKIIHHKLYCIEYLIRED